MILLVGHFGTLYSYATVSGRVAEALARKGMLAGIHNIDETWHGRWRELEKCRAPAPATHLLIVSAPSHFLDVYVRQFGKERSAIFVSPNTTMLAREHAETIGLFGLAIVPSRYCERTVREALDGTSDEPRITRLPLGSPVVTDRVSRQMAAAARRYRIGRSPPQVLHFTSDQALPGRKGTEELLSAWATLKRRDRTGARLTIHAPSSLQRSLLGEVRHLEIDESVSIMFADRLGETDQEILRLYDDADLLVQPSRAEGFGMMFLGALDAGVPMVCTCNTAHAELLEPRPGTWIGVPTPTSGPIAYEMGEAPRVDPRLLACTIQVALESNVRSAMIDAAVEAIGSGEEQIDAWALALPEWVAEMTIWMEDGL